jgi:signal transduction histidine kinase
LVFWADGRPAVEIRVADRGPGIPAEEQRHIFEPFFRGRRAVHDQVHGTGLGLSLAKKIVEAHGGSIRVRSEQGKGTEFIVRIPSMPAELQRERQNEPAHSIG